MEANALHDLTAAYALDALDADDARAYEDHLARCARCRHELAELSEAAGALALATDAPAPPPELRTQILEQARRERENVVPLRPRRIAPIAAAAAVAACVAVGLGIWATSLSNKLDRRDAALAREQRVAAILASPGARTVPFARGTLVVSRSGAAALVVHNLDAPQEGKTYEAWISAGGPPRPAGTFDGGNVVAVPLTGQVAPGASVLVTEERHGGVDAPTQKPFLSVQS
ncbi:MAG: anti-sigma factor domain-containing protein [Gaiellaceae bacterium]